MTEAEKRKIGGKKESEIYYIMQQNADFTTVCFHFVCEMEGLEGGLHSQSACVSEMLDCEHFSFFGVGKAAQMLLLITR